LAKGNVEAGEEGIFQPKKGQRERNVGSHLALPSHLGGLCCVTLGQVFCAGNLNKGKKKIKGKEIISSYEKKKLNKKGKQTRSESNWNGARGLGGRRIDSQSR